MQHPSPARPTFRPGDNEVRALFLRHLKQFRDDPTTPRRAPTLHRNLTQMIADAFSHVTRPHAAKHHLDGARRGEMLDPTQRAFASPRVIEAHKHLERSLAPEPFAQPSRIAQNHARRLRAHNQLPRHAFTQPSLPVSPRHRADDDQPRTHRRTGGRKHHRRTPQTHSRTHRHTAPPQPLGSPPHGTISPRHHPGRSPRIPAQRHRQLKRMRQYQRRRDASRQLQRDLKMDVVTNRKLRAKHDRSQIKRRGGDIHFRNCFHTRSANTVDRHAPTRVTALSGATMRRSGKKNRAGKARTRDIGPSADIDSRSIIQRPPRRRAPGCRRPPACGSDWCFSSATSDPAYL